MVKKSNFTDTMRKILCLACSILVASCSALDSPKMEDNGPAKVYATVDNPDKDAGTRIYLGDDLRLYWNADDRISYFDKEIFNYHYRFDGASGDRSGTFSKVKSVFHSSVEISHVYGVYPYDERNAVDEDDETLTVWFPSVQAYAEGSIGQGANVMAAVSDDNNLKFKNLGGYLCIKLYGDDVSVKSVSITGNSGEQLSGEANVKMEIGGIPQTSIVSSGTGKAVKVECSSPVAIGKSPDDYTSFWFVIPPVSFSNGFTMKVEKNDGGTFEKSTAKSLTIKRNVITSMTPVKVD